ncbi:MAG: hypothetical protein WC738_04390 [Candidatus Omnitrophota bacterium]|jgi:hypothetical protein
MKLKHRKSIEIPKLEDLSKEGVLRFGEELGKMLWQTLRNIYDDLVSLGKAEVITTLPVASAEYRGKTFIVPQAGLDKVYICLYNTGAATYSWNEITI